jgi:hypothetical protein
MVRLALGLVRVIPYSKSRNANFFFSVWGATRSDLVRVAPPYILSHFSKDFQPRNLLNFLRGATRTQVGTSRTQPFFWHFWVARRSDSHKINLYAFVSSQGCQLWVPNS